MIDSSPLSWHQATALVTIGATGITGFSFVPKAASELTSPSSLPVTLMALEKAAAPVQQGDTALRPAIVNVARHFLALAQNKSPSQMEALIWQHVSLDGADHGPSCAAFAALTLELGARATGQQSWVTGGTSYPWPLHKWADVRVDENPASPGITSIVQDAQTHGRWHPLGDGYTPKPGDWVLFSQHVEVITGDQGGVLHTIGDDSAPNFSVNAHEYPAPFGAQGVAGFVDNGHLTSAPQVQPSPAQPAAHARPRPHHGPPAGAAIPGLPTTRRVPEPSPARVLAPVIPGLQPVQQHHHKRPAAAQAPLAQASNATSSEQAFIQSVAPGAISAQQKYGVPASVTIAQAIQESGWGQSSLASQDHNLFGIKGSGPAGSVTLPTTEYVNGSAVSTSAAFRVYHNVAQSIEDHGALLATSGYYGAAMSHKHDANAFANALTGVYATDPSYGATLIGLMQRYGLYQYDHAPKSPAPLAPAVRHQREHRVAAPVSLPALPAIPGVPSGSPAPSLMLPVKALYQPRIPLPVKHAFSVRARKPLQRMEPLHRDVAGQAGIPWQVLAACDWMQCGARQGYSPVHGEKLGTLNEDGTGYRIRSQALARCARDLTELAWSVYHIDLARPGPLSVGELACVFAAYRWGELLKVHHTSALEFPYSVEGLTGQHLRMRWPRIFAPHAPDKPGSRFRQPFGAVPAALILGYPATI